MGEKVLRKHLADRPAQNPLGILCHRIFKSFLLHVANITRVLVIYLVRRLLSGHDNTVHILYVDLIVRNTIARIGSGFFSLQNKRDSVASAPNTLFFASM